MTTDTTGRYAPDHIKRLKDAIEGECDGLTINDKHAEAILQYVFEDATHALRAAQRPTETQMLEAAEKAGLWPNTVRHWIPALKRYHDALMAHAAQRPADLNGLTATDVVNQSSGDMSIKAAQDDRAAFEALCKKDHTHPASITGASMWKAWQAALASRPVPPPISDDAETQRGLMLSWAVDRWNAEVKNRPLVNVHRRTLDDTWRQVMRYCGGDPSALVGPSHDDLLDAAPKRNGIPIAEERTTQPQASRCGLPECFGKPMCQKCTDQQIRQAVDGHANESQWKGGV